MGASASKASRAAGSATRQYPTRTPPTSTQAAPRRTPPPPPPPQSQLGPNAHPQPQASNSRSEAINLDASDPDFAASLRSLGAVQPNPTLSPSSAFGRNAGNPSRASPNPRMNPALVTIEARSRLQEEADREFEEAGRKGNVNRQFLDMYMIRQILVLREQGKSAEAIEKSMGLKKGVVDRLGPKGMVELTTEQGRATREVEIV